MSTATYIDKSEAILKIMSNGIQNPIYCEQMTRAEQEDYVIGLIESCKTVDAVEVVRCRNCKYYKLDEHSLGSEGQPLHYCDRDGGLDWFVSGDMFCSYGENRQ